MIKMYNDHQFFRRCLLTMRVILFYLNTANSNTTESPTSTEAPPIREYQIQLLNSICKSTSLKFKYDTFKASEFSLFIKEKNVEN